MSFMPTYIAPDFSRPDLAAAPCIRTVPAPANGVLPDGFHATSNHPEYFHTAPGNWQLVREGRMDGVCVLHGETLAVMEPRLVRKGDFIIIGRSENGEEGIFVHTTGFTAPATPGDKFSFRGRDSRESSFSRSYDTLYDIMRYDRNHGHIVWVAGPALTFDRDSRAALSTLIDAGYCHALLAGNALATHDLEAALFGTALGLDIYSRIPAAGGHCNHLDAINLVRRSGSIAAALRDYGLTDGIMAACVRNMVPYVLAGSIRDDGPLPGVIGDAYAAQDAMRQQTRRATTVIALASQLHSIATGNMLPGYQVDADNSVRPVFFYVVDMSEFSVDKLANRGSLQATAILTNVQDFMVNLRRTLIDTEVTP
jgi:lysine-ketoglutarate reductase/saccharopine dehydrogenase-like protein (TIGR00300 family)